MKINKEKFILFKTFGNLINFFFVCFFLLSFEKNQYLQIVKARNELLGKPGLYCVGHHNSVTLYIYIYLWWSKYFKWWWIFFFLEDPYFILYMYTNGQAFLNLFFHTAMPKTHAQALTWINNSAVCEVFFQ